MTSNNAPAHTFHLNCSACALAGVCLPVAIVSDELDLLDSLIQRRRPIARDDHIYRAGQPFGSLYAVRSGAIKTYRLTPDGQEQIVGFHLPGEIFGLDGPAHDVYGSSAVALESTAFCEIPFARVGELAAQLPGTQQHLLRLMSREITDDHHLLVLLSKRTAEERIASFLIALSSRFRRRHLSSTRFRLPMSRADIANYLGLVIETVSRVLTRLQRQGVLALNQRELEILDSPRLYEIANLPMPAATPSD